MKTQAPVRTVGPANPILTLADAKTQVRVDSNDENALIESLVAAAEAHLDGYSGALGQALVTQTWTQKFSSFPDSDRLRLALGPIQSVESVSYYDGSGNVQTFSGYRVATDGIGPMIVLNDTEVWPVTYERPDAVTVTWICGFGDAGDVPADIIHAARLLVAHWFDSRAAVVSGNFNEVPMAVNALISKHRKVGV